MNTTNEVGRNPGAMDTIRSVTRAYESRLARTMLPDPARRPAAMLAYALRAVCLDDKPSSRRAVREYVGQLERAIATAKQRAKQKATE